MTGDSPPSIRCGANETNPPTPTPAIRRHHEEPDDSDAAAGGTSTLTITLSNASTTAATLNAPLTDTLPSGVVVSGSASTTCGGTASTGVSSVALTGGTIPANGSCSLMVNVVAANGGSFINSLRRPGDEQRHQCCSCCCDPDRQQFFDCHAHAWQGFSPATIAAGGTSTLTITLTNANTTAATLNAPFTDTLPSGVVVSGTASTTCAGGTASTGAPAVASQARGLPKPQWFGGNGGSTAWASVAPCRLDLPGPRARSTRLKLRRAARRAAAQY
jgi:uncharacterized repeat protein (TIGR01451 family)